MLMLRMFRHFQDKVFYKTTNGLILPDPHYNHAKYYHFFNEIKKIL